YNSPAVRREGVQGNEGRRRLMVYLGLANSAEFFGGKNAGIKLVAGGELNAAIGRQQRKLRAAAAVVDERTQGKGADVNGQRDSRQLHVGGAQNLDLAAGKKCDIWSRIAEIAEKNVRDRAAHRVAALKSQALLL